jgi:hypothetical protein
MIRRVLPVLLTALTLASISTFLLFSQVLACTGGGTWPKPC